MKNRLFAFGLLHWLFGAFILWNNNHDIIWQRLFISISGIALMTVGYIKMKESIKK